MYYKQYIFLCLAMLVLGQTATLPQSPQYSQQLQQGMREDKKFIAKPNAVKKVAVEETDLVNNNIIEEADNSGFSWTNIVSMAKQVLLGKGAADPSKNEIESDVPTSAWKSVISIALKIITAVIGGPRYNNIEGLDKENEQPLQFSTLVMNLLEILRASFSQRSLAARSTGRRDTVSEAASASIVMLKGYMKSMRSMRNVGPSENEDQQGCAERAICEANAECVADARGTSSIFCQLGSYATSYVLQKQSGKGFESLYEAGRRGRIGGDCRALFVGCKAV
ncbi:uncharacterized protein LOC143184908 [Calliopsis andreniformis]|uniref:uncharacterized protein LOC143184908 n=1 Tax=Calliopsis andreniformis TaxID=337506 RepID=UPI003FCD6FD2